MLGQFDDLEAIKVRERTEDFITFALVQAIEGIARFSGFGQQQEASWAILVFGGGRSFWRGDRERRRRGEPEAKYGCQEDVAEEPRSAFRLRVLHQVLVKVTERIIDSTARKGQGLRPVK